MAIHRSCSANCTSGVDKTLKIWLTFFFHHLVFKCVQQTLSSGQDSFFNFNNYSASKKGNKFCATIGIFNTTLLYVVEQIDAHYLDFDANFTI